MKGFNSKLVHGDKNFRDKNKDKFGALRTPIYDCAAFEYDSSEEIADAFEGKVCGHAYTRISNPTVAELESRIAYISGAESVVCLSSGMAAISNAVISLCAAGDNIITSKYLFGNTYSLFKNTIASFGIEARFVDLTNPEEIKNNIDEKTRAIFLENITNPHLIIFDMEKISTIADENDLILIVDNTLLTNYIFDCKKFGVDIEVISNTKIISGGGTSVGGSIIAYKSDKWAKNPKLNLNIKEGEVTFMKSYRKEIYKNFGSCLSPQNAYYQILGLETMSLRIDKNSGNALKVAKFLETEEKVKSVNYTGLTNNKYHSLTKKQFKGNGGSLLTFELGSKEECYKFMNELSMIRRSTNLCENKTLIIHPYSTIFCEYSEDKKKELEISDKMLRLSLGIEDACDIIEDIKKALTVL